MSIKDKLAEQVGMPAMTDAAIAADLLLAAKTSVRTYAVAITEAATPKVREVLQRQLNQEIEFHAMIAQYMIDNGLYKSYDVNELLKDDIKKAEMVINLPNP